MVGLEMMVAGDTPLAVASKRGVSTAMKQLVACGAELERDTQADGRYALLLSCTAH